MDVALSVPCTLRRRGVQRNSAGDCGSWRMAPQSHVTVVSDMVLAGVSRSDEMSGYLATCEPSLRDAAASARDRRRSRTP